MSGTLYLAGSGLVSGLLLKFVLKLLAPYLRNGRLALKAEAPSSLDKLSGGDLDRDLDDFLIFYYLNLF